MSKSFYQLYSEAIPPNMPTKPLMSIVSDQMRAEKLEKEALAIGKSFANKYVLRPDLSDEEKKYFFSDIITAIIQTAKMPLDIPGYGKIWKIGKGPRTYEKEDKARKSRHTEHIRSQYQDLLGKGLSHEQAVEKLKTMWRGLDDKNLNSILRSVKPETPVASKPASTTPAIRNPHDPNETDLQLKKYGEILSAVKGNKLMAKNELMKWLSQSEQYGHIYKPGPSGKMSPKVQSGLEGLANLIIQNYTQVPQQMPQTA